MLKWFLDSKENYFTKQYASFRGYPSYYLNRWAANNEYFAEIYEQCKEIQEIRLLEGAMNGKFESKISALALMQHHGYKTCNAADNHKQQVQITITKNYPNKIKEVKQEDGIHSSDTETTDSDTGAGANRLGLLDKANSSS